ncbi:MAG TPA: hypothetical protein VM598_03310 [Bdellovibrionota bacterium]|nr:hypothetical protein [Bdellovibrionota bacterium]
MRNLLLFFMIVPTLALAQGGVGAGSGGGRGRYSEVQGFIVRHSDTLVVTEVSAKKTRIDNSRSGQRRVSKIEFETVQNTYRDFDHLEREMRKRHPRRPWERIDLAGATALASLRRDEGRLRGLYYILTSSSTLIRAELDAYADGQGIELIEPIVHTFAYDHTGPVVHELRIEETVLAGNRARLMFRATDDHSGIDTDFPVSSRLVIHEGSANPIEIHGAPSPLEDEPGWYYVDFAVNPFQIPGKYSFNEFSVTDRAGNSSHYARWRREEPLRSAPRLEIINVPGASDAGFPRIHEARLPEQVHAGGANRVLVRADDDLSGIDVDGRTEWTGFGSVSIDGYRSVGLLLKGRVSTASDPILAQAGWYELEFELSTFLPAGRLRIEEIWLRDRAGNERRHRFRFNELGATVVPTQNADYVPPKVLELRFPGPLVAGHWGRLFLRVDEKGAGLDPKQFFAVLRARDFYGQSAMIHIRDGLTPEYGIGPGWYSIAFQINEHVPAGSYFLDWLKVSDLAGHRAGYNAYDDGRYHPESHGYKRTPLRVLWTRIER